MTNNKTSRKIHIDNNTKWLHCFGQVAHHTDVTIIGNKKALLSLQKQIEAVLKKQEETNDDICFISYNEENGNRKDNEYFVNDGEGYGILVSCVENLGILEYNLPIPYSDPELWSEREERKYGNLYYLCHEKED